MTQDLGAQQADGLSQAEPVVSALRASIPSAESIETVDGVRAVFALVTACESELRDIREELQLRRRQLEFEANKTDHPWIGKAVVREVTKRKRRSIWYRGPTEYVTRTERGIVAIQGTGRSRYRGHWPSPGEVFVISKSGATAYQMGDDWSLAQAIEAGTGETEGLDPKGESAVLAEDAPK